MKLTENDFIRLKNFMHINFGINLEKKKILIETRLALSIKKLGFNDFKSYIDALMVDKSGELVSILVERLTTNFTYFMREEMHYEFLKKEVFIPNINKPPIGGIKIWSAASSTGEEAYCIAMLASSVFGNGSKHVYITASDISDKVLNKAKKGIYTQDKISKLPKNWTSNFFNNIDSKTYEIKDSIKSLVEFKYFNLNKDIGWNNQKYDVIFCRNVMIYFDNNTKQKLAKKLYQSLKPGGYLIIGMSENLSSLNIDFDRIKPSIYRKKYNK